MDAEPPPVVEPALEDEPSEALDPPADSEFSEPDLSPDFLPPLPSDFFSFESLSDFLSEDSESSYALSEDFEPLTPVLPEAVVEPETDASLATTLSPVRA